MIQSIELGNLKNAEYLQFQKDIVAIIERNKCLQRITIHLYQSLEL